jgi:hypothetical protein
LLPKIAKYRQTQGKKFPLGPSKIILSLAGQNKITRGWLEWKKKNLALPNS